MPLRSAASASAVLPQIAAPSARQRAAAEVLGHVVVALAVGSALLLLASASVAGLPFLPGGGRVPPFEAWSLMRTSATVQIGATVLAAGLAALARAGGCRVRADRWCLVAALSAAAGAVLLAAPPL
ncbi:hypothetical protein EDF35_1458 [Rathayibacter sp. PhB151]|uniref:hypothetical protein n=1 Tax=Rathayibacter sp. PhB151 TaxID=2485189 RepID=UPI0010624F68|nr:hypothetical protein [Rathayibacter sp. PhB151]TDX81784.1 hypothetical protein EDF35_1458 [Rathayibacter sp. PhB151]